jgi:CheY-like chemotaxis protein
MRILIVEDEKKMAAVLQKGLEADNHRVSIGDYREAQQEVLAELEKTSSLVEKLSNSTCFRPAPARHRWFQGEHTLFWSEDLQLLKAIFRAVF